MKKYFFLLFHPAVVQLLRTNHRNKHSHPGATLDVKTSSGSNSNEGIRAPQLTQTHVAAIPPKKKARWSMSKPRVPPRFPIIPAMMPVSKRSTKRLLLLQQQPMGEDHRGMGIRWHQLHVRTKANGQSSRADTENVFVANDGKMDIGVRALEETFVVNGSVMVGRVHRGITHAQLPSGRK